MLRSLKLVGVGPAPEMEMRFASRLNVLTGDNGLGKSLFLESIWYVLTGNYEELIRPSPHVDAATILATNDTGQIAQSNFLFKVSRWDVRDHFKIDGLCIYARVDGRVKIFDRARPQGGLVGGAYHSFSQKEIINGFRIRDDVICRGLVEDWVTWQEKRDGTAGRRSFEQLSKILNSLSPNPENDELMRPGDPIRLAGDSRTFPTINVGYGATPIIHASAGMQRIISLAYLITWAWHVHVEEMRLLKENPARKVVFLMDEVETHLHPEWQRRILPALLKVLESLGEGMQVQMHVTTHSPMVLASLEPHWDNAKDELFHFALKEGKVVLESSELGRWGTASRWLKSRVFGLHADRSIEAERAMEDANAFMSGEPPTYFKTPEDVDKELERTLWDQDPFWARWVTYMGKSKS